MNFRSIAFVAIFGFGYGSTAMANDCFFINSQVQFCAFGTPWQDKLDNGGALRNVEEFNGDIEIDCVRWETRAIRTQGIVQAGSQVITVGCSKPKPFEFFAGTIFGENVPIEEHLDVHLVALKAIRITQ